MIWEEAFQCKAVYDYIESKNARRVRTAVRLKDMSNCDLAQKEKQHVPGIKLRKYGAIPPVQEL